jgi:hypothetical protein
MINTSVKSNNITTTSIVNKSQAIKFLQEQGWTKADSERAVESIDFKLNPDESTIFSKVLGFAGSELLQRQRLQAAQKGQVTKRNNEIKQKDELNYQLKNEIKQKDLVNDQLKKDNKHLKNLVDAIRLKLNIDVESLLRYEDSEIRQALIRWLKGTQG